MKTYTVFGVMADNADERFCVFVDAHNPKEAEKKAVADTPEEIIIAGVVEGRTPSIDKHEERKVTPIRGRGYETTVARITVSYERIRVPYTCPNCKADLRKPDAVTQWDYWNMFWNGRIPRGEKEGAYGIALNHNRGAARSNGRSPTDMSDTIVAYALHCANCAHALWDGLKEDHDG